MPEASHADMHVGHADMHVLREGQHFRELERLDHHSVGVATSRQVERLLGGQGDLSDSLANKQFTD